MAHKKAAATVICCLLIAVGLLMISTDLRVLMAALVFIGIGIIGVPLSYSWRNRVVNAQSLPLS